MESHFLRGYCAEDATLPDGVDMRVIASTSDVARDGMVIEASGWQLDSFKANPTFMFAHDYTRPPIGTVTDIRVEGDNLVADVRFDSDPFSQMIRDKYVKDHSMRAVSVGWNTVEFAPPKSPTDTPRITKAELLEVSAVPIPADPKALKMHSARGIAELGRDLVALLDETPEPPADDTPPASMTWDDAADQMVRLHLPGLQRPDAERKAAYQTLARTYASHGKHAPEYVPTDTLDAFDLADVRGLFLEGEADRFPQLFGRAGAVLSTRNKSDLEQIVVLATGILERASKEPETPETPEEPSEPRAVNPTLAQLHALIVKKAS